MCSFSLNGIIPSHARDPETESLGQGGGTARLDRGMALRDLSFPQQEYVRDLITTCSITGESRSARRHLPRIVTPSKETVRAARRVARHIALQGRPLGDQDPKMMMARTAKGGTAPTMIPNTKHHAASILVHIEHPEHLEHLLKADFTSNS